MTIGLFFHGSSGLEILFRDRRDWFGLRILFGGLGVGPGVVVALLPGSSLGFSGVSFLGCLSGYDLTQDIEAFNPVCLALGH